MRRVAVHVLRTARLASVRRLLLNKSSPIHPSSCAIGVRSASSTPGRDNGPPPRSTTSMYFRNFSLALVSTLVASGAWYAYKLSPPTKSGGLVQSASGRDSQSPSGGLQHSRTLASVVGDSESPQANPPSAVVEEAVPPTRRALVVENDQFYTGQLIGDSPLSKHTDDAGRKALEMLTPEQATQKLRRNEESYLVGRGRGVVRYDVVQIPSNDPIEDDHAEKIVEVPQSVAATRSGTSSSDWMFWGVFDGHRHVDLIIVLLPGPHTNVNDSGWTTSAKLRQVLISFVARELNATYKSALSDSSLTFPTPNSIDSAIKKGFIRLDHEIIHESVEKVMKANSKRVAAELLAPALSGSCALLSFYDSDSKLLRVACTGDSRAVLGRRGASGKWIATPLSEDQTGGTPSEVARLRKEHPGEDDVVRGGRILGQLEPSRAFGDSFYKWTKETQERIKLNFFGRSPSQLLRTPPYVTAEPVVTTTKVEPEKGDFVVMATDGLWEMLTNEEVVGLVGQWLESQAKASTGNGRNSNSWLKSWASNADTKLPIEKNSQANSTEKSGQRAPIRQQQWQVNSSDNRFVVEDKNAATHLVRNALGGRDRDMVCALLTLPSPYSRRYRDDLTVEVIFFGEDNKSGTVVPNTEASASKSDLKAKL